MRSFVVREEQLQTPLETAIYLSSHEDMELESSFPEQNSAVKQTECVSVCNESMNQSLQ